MRNQREILSSRQAEVSASSLSSRLSFPSEGDDVRMQRELERFRKKSSELTEENRLVHQVC